MPLFIYLRYDRRRHTNITDVGADAVDDETAALLLPIRALDSSGWLRVCGCKGALRTAGDGATIGGGNGGVPDRNDGKTGGGDTECGGGGVTIACWCNWEGAG
jgi:hypothetical protein